jgi:hypothetical protein
MSAHRRTFVVQVELEGPVRQELADILSIVNGAGFNTGEHVLHVHYSDGRIHMVVHADSLAAASAVAAHFLDSLLQGAGYQHLVVDPAWMGLPGRWSAALAFLMVVVTAPRDPAWLHVGLAWPVAILAVFWVGVAMWDFLRHREDGKA